MQSLRTNSQSWLQQTSVTLIKIYQTVRPAMDQIVLTVFGKVSVCKHEPTCSQYMIEQIRSRGTIAGVARGISRILTCY